MSVLSVKKGFSGVEAGGGDSGKTAQEVFSVVTGDPADGAISVRSAVDPVTHLAIPQLNDPHPEDSNYLAGVAHVAKVSPTFFNVRVPYSTRMGEISQASQYDDPLSQPAEYNWTSASSTEPVDREFSEGKPIVNTLGEPFGTPILRDFKDPVLTISRNEAAFELVTKANYEDTVCNEVFWGIVRGRVRMMDIISSTVHAATPYWKVRYTIQFRIWTPPGVSDGEAWFRRVLNQGLKYLDDAGKIRLSPNGEPVLLAEDGTQTDADNPFWLKWQMYYFRTWAELGINL